MLDITVCDLQQKSCVTLHSTTALPLYVISSIILCYTVFGYTFRPFNTGIATLRYKLYYTISCTVLHYTFKWFNTGIATQLYKLCYTLHYTDSTCLYLQTIQRWHYHSTLQALLYSTLHRTCLYLQTIQHLHYHSTLACKLYYSLHFWFNYSPLNSTLFHLFLPDSTIDSTRLHSTLRYSMQLYSTLLFSTLLYSTLLDYMLCYSTLLCATLIYATLRFATLLYSIHSTLLYSTQGSKNIWMPPSRWARNPQILLAWDTSPFAQVFKLINNSWTQEWKSNYWHVVM